MKCPLCLDQSTSFYHADNKREYWQCRCCDLVFVPEKYWLSTEQEKAEYDLHQNDVGDPGYRKFLSRLVEPLQQNIPNGCSGLDFGCGPGPALSTMLKETGYQMDVYDPYYFSDESVFDKKYDFITATEVIEHINSPNEVLPTILEMLTPGGSLGLMTKMVIDKEAFSKWHYKNDMTHVCFYSKATFEYLARKFGMQVLFYENDVILLQKLCNK